MLSHMKMGTRVPAAIQLDANSVIGWAFMRRRAICLGIMLLGPAAWGQVSAQTTAPTSAPPDVYLITIDTLRADHVGCYGYKQVETPALDALAADGIRFTEAELLKKHGYQTAAFIGAVILDSNTLAPGLDHGFDFYDNFPKTDRKDAEGRNEGRNKERWGRVERRGMEVVEHAEAWFDKHRAGPHFVWVHLYDPHDPYEPPPPFSEKYKDHLYDGEIAYADSALANWIAYLKKAGAYDNAIIIVTGDHGEGLGEHGEETHVLF